jgi:hypothetical protein
MERGHLFKWFLMAKSSKKYKEVSDLSSRGLDLCLSDLDQTLM